MNPLRARKFFVLVKEGRLGDGGGTIKVEADGLCLAN
jgi:hypothetical protein